MSERRLSHEPRALGKSALVVSPSVWGKFGSRRVAQIREAADALKVRFSRQWWYAILIASRGVPLS